MQPRDLPDQAAEGTRRATKNRLRATEDTLPAAEEDTLELREEELHVRRELREVGQAHLRTHVEEVPARLEVEAFAEEVEVEHVPIGRVVSERREPYQDGELLVVPIYEEQLVVTKRLILREELHVRRARSVRRELFEDTLRRERLEVDDPDDTGLIRERYAPGDPSGETVAETPATRTADAEREPEHVGPLSNLVRRVLQ